MNGEDVPRSVACDCSLAAEYILSECGDFTVVKQSHFDAANTKQLF